MHVFQSPGHHAAAFSHKCHARTWQAKRLVLISTICQDYAGIALLQLSHTDVLPDLDIPYKPHLRALSHLLKRVDHILHEQAKPIVKHLQSTTCNAHSQHILSLLGDLERPQIVPDRTERVNVRVYLFSPQARA